MLKTNDPSRLLWGLLISNNSLHNFDSLVVKKAALSAGGRGSNRCQLIIIIMMMMMMITMIIVIIIIIEFKGTNLRFLQSPQCAANCLPTRTLKSPGRNRVQITCHTSSAYHVQHVLRTTLYEGTAQLLSLAEFKSHLF